MRAQRTAQPRRACDTTVFSCANGEVSVRSVTLSQSGSHRPVRGLTVPLRRTADVVPTFVVTARFWAILGKFHCPSASLSSQRSRVRTGPDIYFPRRSRVARPRADQCARPRARPPESLGRSPVGCRAVHGGPRRFVPLDLRAVARVCTSQWRLATRLAVRL